MCCVAYIFPARTRTFIFLKATKLGNASVIEIIHLFTRNVEDVQCEMTGNLTSSVLLLLPRRSPDYSAKTKNREPHKEQQ